MSQLDEHLDPQLQDALEQLKTVSPRNPEAAARGRANFLAYAQSLPKPASRPANQRHYLWNNRYSRRLSLATLPMVLLVLGLLLAGTGATVYAAQYSLPNTPLYPVKILSEDIQTALAFQPEIKLRLLISFADRRVNEIAALGLQGAPPPEAATSRLEQQLDEALKLGTEASDPALIRALEEIQVAVQRQLQTLALVQSRAAKPSQPILAQVQAALQERLGLTELGITDPSSFRLKMRGSGTPALTGQEVPPSVTPTELEPRPVATPTAQEYYPSITPPAQKVNPTATRSGQEVIPTAAPPAQEVHPSATPAVKEVIPTLAPPTQGIQPSATPAGQQVHPTLAPPTQEVHPAATPGGQQVQPPPPPPTKEHHP